MKRARQAGIEEVARRFGLGTDAVSRFEALLAALAAEPDPHTTVDPEDAVEVHIADSLSGLEVPEVRSAHRIADIGSGAGFPGLPLAIALPHAQFALIESSSRKASVIERLAAATEVENVRVVARRVEEVARGEEREGYEVVTARALASLPVLAEYAAPLLIVDGVLVAWKGARNETDEAAGVAAASQLGLTAEALVEVEPYPGSRNRHLHVYRKTGPTPDRFPRRPGVAVKRPLA